MKKVKTVKNPHPGDVLKHDFLEPLSISAYKLSKELGVSESLLSQIIHGKKSITPDTAMRLARYFNMSPEFWLNYQRAFDLEELARTKRREYEKIEPLKKELVLAGE